MFGLRFCARALPSCGKWGPLLIAVHGPLTIAASPVAEHGLQTHRLSSCGSWAQLLRGMWDLPRPGLEPLSPALAGRLPTTAPPGKPLYIFWLENLAHLHLIIDRYVLITILLIVFWQFCSSSLFFLLLSSPVVWWLSLVLCLDSFHIIFCVYTRFLLSGYHEGHI